MYTTIIVGTDLSESAQRAVEKAADIAASCDAKVHVVIAFKPTFGAMASSSVEAMAFGGDALQEAEATITKDLEESVGRIVGVLQKGGVSATGYAVPGDPAEVMLSMAEQLNADLIVVGSRGMGSAKRFLLGNVPNRISHHAPCDVLIVQTA